MRVQSSNKLVVNEKGSSSSKGQKHFSKISYEVLIPARDEETNISKVIDLLKKQTISPAKILLLNDNSTDKTRELGKELNLDVIDFPIKHPNWINDGKLGMVFSYGMKKFDRKNSHFMILGADHMLPPNYAEDCINLMNENNVDICSGCIEKEITESPRGSGRIFSRKAMDVINWEYSSNHGFETHALMKIRANGLKDSVFPIMTKTLRATGTKYSKKKYFHMGYSYRSLGYPMFYGLGRGLVMSKQHGSFNGFMFSAGYLSNIKNRYESQIRNQCRSYLNYQFKDVFLRPRELLEKF